MPKKAKREILKIMTRARSERLGGKTMAVGNKKLELKKRLEVASERSHEKKLGRV
jgi:hypothetical protein